MNISLDYIKKEWKNILQILKKNREMIIYASLSNSKPVAYKNNTLVLEFEEGYISSKIRLEQPDEYEKVSKAISCYLKENIQLRFQIAGKNEYNSVLKDSFGKNLSDYIMIHKNNKSVERITRCSNVFLQDYDEIDKTFNNNFFSENDENKWKQAVQFLIDTLNICLGAINIQCNNNKISINVNKCYLNNKNRLVNTKTNELLNNIMTEFFDRDMNVEIKIINNCSLDSIKGNWNNIIKFFKEKRQLIIYHALSCSIPIHYEDGILTLEFEEEYLEDVKKVKRQPYYEKLNNYISEYLEEEITVKFVLIC